VLEAANPSLARRFAKVLIFMQDTDIEQDTGNPTVTLGLQRHPEQ
jgi:hypothetical protein